MTHEEFHKLPFRMVSHISFGTEHLSVYQAETPKGGIVIQTRTRKLKNGDYGKSKKIYFFCGKEFYVDDRVIIPNEIKK